MHRHLSATALCLLLAACGGDDGIPAPPDVDNPPADATTRPSGLIYKPLIEGTGDRPTVNDSVTVHYTGWTTDGNMFDSSVARGTPATFGVRDVIPGWTEGLQLMNVGGTYRLWIPQELAYMGRPNRPAGTLVFDVELISITSE